MHAAPDHITNVGFEGLLEMLITGDGRFQSKWTASLHFE